MWRSGDLAVLRFRPGGRTSFVRPVTVVEDTRQRSVLFLRAGTPTKVRVYADGSTIVRDTPYAERWARPWLLGDGTWGPNHTLLVTAAGAAHSIWHFWSTDWDFLGWYVNLQTPLVRTQVGFDTVDHVLDLVVEPDGTVSWKDEAELAVAVEVGRFSASDAAAIRAEGERVLAARPWPTGWERWRPDPAWPIPGLPTGWDAV
jgi:uncharacterized protein